MRQALPWVLALVWAAGVGRPDAAAAQGQCLHAAGTPACNTAPITPVFAPTGWHTTALDQLTIRVADPRKEAAFYTALLGWSRRNDEGDRVVMDLGTWGSVVLTRATGPSAGAAATMRPPSVVVSMGFAIEPWDAGAVERALRTRGLAPVADNDGLGFESFHVKDPDGFDLQLGNGKGRVAARQASPAPSSRPGSPFAPTGWRTVWLDHLSYTVTDYKKTASFYQNLLGWTPTYDEGSQHELLMGDLGDIIIRGGNPLNPVFARTRSRRSAVLDHMAFGIAPWDTGAVRAALLTRGLAARADTAGSGDIHAAPYKSYHTVTPGGFNLQISNTTRETRLTVATAVRPTSAAAGERRGK